MADMPDAAPPTDMPEDKARAPKVIATIFDNGDGTYQLVRGDENEIAHDGPEGAKESAAMGESFAAAGDLLKAVLDIVKETDGTMDGMGQENFEAGFEGREAKKSAPKPPQAMA